MGRPLPELSRLPLIGNLAEFRRDRVALLRRLFAECGDAGAFHLGPRPVAVFSSREAAREVLLDKAEHFEKGPILRQIARPVLGNGLLSIDNAHHRARRREVQPAFGPRPVAALATTMVACTDRALSELSDGQEIDLADVMTQLTLRIIGRTLFSVDLVDEAPELAAAFERVLHHVTERLGSLVPIPRWAPTPGNLHTKRALHTLDAAISRMIAQRHAGESQGDLLSLLVSSELDERAIRDECMTLFVAGHETVATALAWTWHLLMRHPAHYDRAQADSAFALACIKESMRLYPPAHSVGRQATRDIDICGFEVPAGTPLLVSLLLMQRREDYFPNANQFQPERFLDNAEDRWPKLSYLPFGAGTRQCIGNHLALTEAHLVVTTIARRLRFEPLDTHEIAPEMHVTLRPSGGVHARVRVRGG